jgi:hypothetical protein
MISDKAGTKALKQHYTDPQQLHHLSTFNEATTNVDKLELATTSMLEMHLKSRDV